MIKALANLFRGVHKAAGITAPPPDASPAEERAFVGMWLLIVAVIIAWCAFLLYLMA